jgi:hypothetical protein
LVTAKSLQKADRAKTNHVPRKLWLIKADFDVTLGAQVVDLVRLNQIQDSPKAAGIPKIPVVKDESRVFMRIAVQVINSVSVE